MDNLFLFDENEEIDKDHINENDIIHRRTNIQECVDNRQGIYDISKLINKDVSRENILLSTNDLQQLYDNDTQHLSHDSHKLIFDLSMNNLGGITYKKNVIGFRLNECIFTAPVYTIQKGINDTIKIIDDANIYVISEGYYTMSTLIIAINSKLSGSATLSYPNDNVIITATSDTIKFSNENSKLLYSLGFHEFPEDSQILANGKYFTVKAPEPHVADTYPSLITGIYLDVVVDEIPYGACKQNPRGLNIIHRLPVRTESDSSIIYYKSNFIDYEHQYLFPPINLSQLTIHLYKDGEELPRDNLTISFEFELTILNK